MKLKLGLKAKLITYTASISALSILLVSAVGTIKSKSALLDVSQNQLESSSHLMKKQIESYIKSSETYTALLSKDRLIEGLFIAFEGAFYGDAFESDKDQDIQGNSYKSNDKIYGERTRKMSSDFSFSNILLASMNGQVIMSAAQDKTNSFLGRSLTQGVLKESALAKCFNKALNSDSMHFADFQIYSTSGNVHSFLCQKALAEFDHEDDGIYIGDTLGLSLPSSI